MEEGLGQMRGARVRTVIGFGEFWVIQEKVFGGMGPRESNGSKLHKVGRGHRLG